MCIVGSTMKTTFLRTIVGGVKLSAFAVAILTSVNARAADIRVIANPGMKAVLEELAPGFKKAGGHTLNVQYGLFKQLKSRIDAADFDVAITTGESARYLIERDKFAGGTRADIARVGIGVAVRQGAPKPDIATTASFKQALLNAKFISYTQGSTAGVYLAGLMERLGIADAMKPKTKFMGGGGQNPRAVAAGEVELGLSIISDIVSVPGVEVLGPLPPELQNYVVETAGISVAAKDRPAAGALLAFLKAPPATAAFKAQGFEPMPQ